MLLSLKSRFVGNVYVIECVGRIVLGEEVKALEAALELAEREFTQIVLNLSEVNRLDSIAMGLLVRYAERLGKRGGGLRLAGPPAFVTNLLNMTKLSTMLPSYPKERRGPRVLLFDESPDLCVFVRTVLMGQGYDVRSTCSFRDAKILLRVDGVEYIVVGPSTPRLSAETVVHSLTALSPNANVLQLAADFKIRDAQEATDALLQMFAGSGAS